MITRADFYAGIFAASLGLAWLVFTLQYEAHIIVHAIDKETGPLQEIKGAHIFGLLIYALVLTALALGVSWGLRVTGLLS